MLNYRNFFFKGSSWRRHLHHGIFMLCGRHLSGFKGCFMLFYWVVVSLNWYIPLSILYYRIHLLIFLCLQGPPPINAGPHEIAQKPCLYKNIISYHIIYICMVAVSIAYIFWVLHLKRNTSWHVFCENRMTQLHPLSCKIQISDFISIKSLTLTFVK